jgi:hypothetical protein
MDEPLSPAEIAAWARNALKGNEQIIKKLSADPQWKKSLDYGARALTQIAETFERLAAEDREHG